ncbi:MAG TPA: sigma 54-interacting transcriptional regulator [Nitrospirae bacterium]|nr:sigma 54-interacting transcriptional regulator [Nitrospirota bacterium]
MNFLPVFSHTIDKINEALDEKAVSFNTLSKIFLIDPGLLYNLFIYVAEKNTNADIRLIQSCLSIIGEKGIREIITRSKTVLDLDQEFNYLWAYSMLVRISAESICSKIGIYEKDTAVLASLLPVAGILSIYSKNNLIKVLIPLLLKLNTEDKIFIQEKVFGTNHITEMEILQPIPEILVKIIYMTGIIFSREGKRLEVMDNPSRFSESYDIYQLIKMMELSEAITQSILYPSLIETHERGREYAKKHFQIPESDFEFLLEEVFSEFDSLCHVMQMSCLSEEILQNAGRFTHRSFSFLTTSETFNKELERLYIINREGKNILIYGEPDVGKRLLLASLLQRHDNPNKNKSFISVYCSGINNENFESELFGAKGGFMGFSKHCGSLDIVKENGTILLKNIDMMSIELQERLAKTFFEGFFYKIGDVKPTFFNCRIFMTTRLNPKDSKGISDKLIKIVNPEVFHIPPLRERRDDIELIANAVISKYNLPITDESLFLGLREYYDNHEFRNNLLDLKRLLFYVSARNIIASKKVLDNQ